jgi:translation initiation factor IF-2
MPSKTQKKPGNTPGIQTPPSGAQSGQITRSPVVVIMGHIDHGKSTLLDYIRKSNIVAGEAGGITQHVGAYQVEHTTAEGKKGFITFIDTPGHAAFTSIRERGARAADIAILVVSAEDGVKPQTIEALRNIRESKLPFIVAITKIDKPNANIDKAKQSLGENEVYVEGWGGDTPVVPLSAVTGEGIPEFLDTIILLADLTGFTADLNAPVSGVIIESTLDSRKGVSATLLLKNGTLTTGYFLVAGKSYAPVRFIENFKGEKIDKGLPSMPIRIIGWTQVPPAGADFVVVSSRKEAERMTEEFAAQEKRKSSAAPVEPRPQVAQSIPGATAEPSKNVTIPLVIKADVIGSLEGIKHELAAVTHDKVKLKIVSEGIGDINENDIKSAQSDPNIIVLGFNANPDKKAAPIIDRLGINVKTFTIIYELTEFVRQTLTSKIPKEYEEIMTGRAQILALFSKEKDRQVIGGKVESGTIENGNDVRIMRRGSEIGRGRIRELQTKKQRTQEVAEGHEFGMLVEAKVEIAPGDRIEAVKTVEKKQ